MSVDNNKLILRAVLLLVERSGGHHPETLEQELRAAITAGPIPTSKRLTDEERVLACTCIMALLSRLPSHDHEHDVALSALRKLQGVDKIVSVTGG